MTVAFLGAVGRAAAYEAWQCLAEGRELGGSWEFVLGRTLPFGDPACPSALSVVPTPDTTAQTTAFLGDHRNTARIAAGLKPETRSARPHATIARIKRRAPDPLRAAALKWATAMPSLDVAVRVHEIALYTWTEDRTKELFRIVERHSLE